MASSTSVHLGSSGPQAFDPRHELTLELLSTHIPQGYQAIFSTINGTKAMRNPPSIAPDHTFWEPANILNFSNMLYGRFPHHCKYIQPLKAWHELFMYFDKFDVHTHGALNLWNTINHMAHNIQSWVRELQQKAFPGFERNVAQLLEDEDRRNRLRDWDPEDEEDIINCFEEGELAWMDGTEEFYLPTIRHIMLNHHIRLRNKSNMSAQSNMSAPKDVQKPSKFDNINVNGIVIVDGTSKTAARNAAVGKLPTTDSVVEERPAESLGVTSVPPTSGGTTSQALSPEAQRKMWKNTETDSLHGPNLVSWTQGPQQHGVTNTGSNAVYFLDKDKGKDRQPNSSVLSDKLVHFSPDPACRNRERIRGLTWFEAGFVKYDPCDCRFCQAKDRTIFVSPVSFRGADKSSNTAISNLGMAFEQFGEIDDIKVLGKGRFTHHRRATIRYVIQVLSFFASLSLSPIPTINYAARLCIWATSQPAFNPKLTN